MDREELEEELICADCGALFWTNAYPAYLWGESGVLCFECAVKRGGEFDAELDRWVCEPNVGDLPDERRPHP